ncbi:MAG: helix-turn-helix domain-containing protein [Gammaproteobacteria bacterium]|nr:helix-turn-helix domain-containing protein [Gammaproteobacteria bacterium]
MNEFQKLLKEHVKRKGSHNIAGLAGEIGLTSANFSKWLNGRVKHPDCGKIARCAEVLGLTPEEREEFFKAVNCSENIVPAAQPLSPARASPVIGMPVPHPPQFFGQTEQLQRVKRAWGRRRGCSMLP